MKAAVLTHYDKKGTDLDVREIPMPVPEEDEILMKIIAAAVNPLDNMIIRGEVKLIVPYAMPLVMGNEFAGIVEKTGKNASRFQPGDRELPNEFKVLKEGGNLVSLRGLPNGRFARRSGLPFFKWILFQLAGSRYDRMAAAQKQTYDFLFVHEDGRQLDRIGRLFDREHPLETSIDTVFTLDEVNAALNKVKQGKSKGKTILKIGDQ